MVLSFTDLDSSQIVALTPLAGLTNTSYKLMLATGEVYVLRQRTPKALLLGADCFQEAQILSSFSAFDFCPQLQEKYANFILLEWIEGERLTHYAESTLKALASHLASVHLYDFQAVSSLKNITQFDLFERCQKLWRQLPQSVQPHFDLSSLMRISPFASAICHHDIHLGNLIQTDQQLVIIDWEYAAISDPALDIALFLLQNKLHSWQKVYFLKHYFSITQFSSSIFTQKMVQYSLSVKLLNSIWLKLNQILSA